jgi:hypothetical protein
MTEKNIGTYLMTCEDSQFVGKGWERQDAHDGTTLLPQFDVEDGRVYLLRRSQPDCKWFI